MIWVPGASLAVVPASADCPAALRAAPDDGWPTPGAAASAVGAATPAAEAAELADPPEHPARSIPPASMTPPIPRPAAAPNRVGPVRADRRVKLRLLRMAGGRGGGGGRGEGV